MIRGLIKDGIVNYQLAQIHYWFRITKSVARDSILTNLAAKLTRKYKFVLIILFLQFPVFMLFG